MDEPKYQTHPMTELRENTTNGSQATTLGLKDEGDNV
jgi:hypothetical protein